MIHHVLSEDGLIRVIQRTVKSRGRVRLGIGDDAAVLQDGTVITTDSYAAGVHFDLSYMTPGQVGERCACGAISDVVAMAAEPEAVLVSLALPAKRGRGSRVGGRGTADGVRSTVRELYRGIESVCVEMGCEVAGGDTIAADRLLLALTVTGKTRAPKLRSGAMAGDSLYVTGYLGSAEAGRVILADEVRNQKPETKSQNRRSGQRKAGSGWRMARSDWCLPLVRRHLRPIPRLRVMQAVKSHIHGMIDTSDGLGTDTRHLCDMSGVKIVLDAEALPVRSGVSRFCAEKGLDPIDFALGAGEDYELLLTSRHRLPGIVSGVKVTRIGRVEKGRGLRIRREGVILPVTVTGYDHLGFDNG